MLTKHYAHALTSYVCLGYESFMPPFSLRAADQAATMRPRPLTPASTLSDLSVLAV